MPQQRRFAIALSFPGEHRRMVREIACELAKRMGKERIFYAPWRETDLVGSNLDSKLRHIYADEADMVVPFFSRHYLKDWCRTEWKAIRGILMKRKDDPVVPVQIDNTPIEGWESTDLAIRKGSRSSKEIADQISRVYEKRFGSSDSAMPSPPSRFVLHRPEGSSVPNSNFKPLIRAARGMADWLASARVHWGARYSATKRDQTVANSAEGLFLCLAPPRLRSRLGLDIHTRQKASALSFLLSRINRQGLPSVSLSMPKATVQCTSLGLYVLAKLCRRDPEMSLLVPSGKLRLLWQALRRSAGQLGWGTDTSRPYHSEAEVRVPFNFWALRALNAANFDFATTHKLTERILFAMLEARGSLPFGFALEDEHPRVASESLFLILLHELRFPGLRQKLLGWLATSNCTLDDRLAFVLDGFADKERFVEHEEYEILQEDRPSKKLYWLHVSFGYALQCLSLYRDRLKPKAQAMLRRNLGLALQRFVATTAGGRFVSLPRQHHGKTLDPYTFVTAYCYLGLSEYLDAVLPADAPDLETTIIDKVGLAAIRGQRILLVRNRGTSLLIMPGGRVEGKETVEQTLQREVREELSCDVDLRSLTYLGEYCDDAANDPGKKVIIHLYQGRLAGQIQMANEIEHYEWFDTVTGDRSQLSKIVRNQILPDLRRKRLLGPLLGESRGFA